MSKIDIRRAHSMPLAQARKLAEKIADDLKGEFDLTWHWDGDHLHFSRSGVEGTLKVTRSEIRIEVGLGLLLGMLKPRIENRIISDLDRIFTQPTRIAGSSRSRKG